MRPKVIRTSPPGPLHGFTLIELLVSMGVITLLMLILVSTVDQTQRVWKRTSTKVSQFQGARSAFESLTRNLSQATLNTYYGVEYAPDGKPRGYYRASELHYASGKASQSKFLGGDEFEHPTHAVFFQAPLGITADTGTSNNAEKLYRNLSNLLVGTGYFVEWGDDKQIPEFLKGTQSGGVPLVPERYRYRLMEIMQPAEALSIYATEDAYGAGKTKFVKTTDWIQCALGRIAPANGTQPKSFARVRAENIVALIVLPKLPEGDRNPPGSDKVELAEKYEYDSRPADSAGRAKKKENIIERSHEGKQFNQLPPIVQVVMVAIDEASAARQQLIGGEEPPQWTAGLFNTINVEGDLLEDLGDPADPQPNTLIYRLSPPDKPAQRMEYRIYSADVIMRGSKWNTIDEVLE